jgi:hypothetical protein
MTKENIKLFVELHGQSAPRGHTELFKFIRGHKAMQEITQKPTIPDMSP